MLLLILLIVLIVVAIGGGAGYAGGPQYGASWLFPLIPAAPETLIRFAKYGVMRVACRLNW